MSTQPKLIKKDYDKFEIDAALKGNGDCIHIVFVADSGPSMYMFHATESAGLVYNQAANLAETVNIQNETGSLQPIAITIVPKSVYGNRNDLGNHDIMYRHIVDVFEANEHYLRCAEIFFCFEQRPDFDRDLAYQVVEEIRAENIFTHVSIISELY